MAKAPARGASKTLRELMSVTSPVLQGTGAQHTEEPDHAMKEDLPEMTCKDLSCAKSPRKQASSHPKRLEISPKSGHAPPFGGKIPHVSAPPPPLPRRPCSRGTWPRPRRRRRTSRPGRRWPSSRPTSTSSRRPRVGRRSRRTRSR